MLQKKVIRTNQRWIFCVGALCLLALITHNYSCVTENTGFAGKKRGQYRLARLHYANSDGEKGVTTFGYDQDGLMVKALWQLLDGSRSSLNFYTYDKNGNLLKKYREFSDGLNSTQMFQYDANNQLIFEDFSRSDGVKGETSYVYDDTGKCLEADCRGLNGWFFGVINYTYDDQNKKNGAEIKREGQKIGTIKYSYDKNGNLFEEYWDLSGSWNQTFTNEYEYEELSVDGVKPFTSSNIFLSFSASNSVTNEDYDYNDESRGPSFYTYDDAGRLIQKTFERSDGLETITDYFYDIDNKLVKSLRRYAGGGSGIFSYEYNAEAQMIRRTFKHIDGSSAEEFYQYDKDGKLLKGVWDNVDTWLSGIITFTYNGNEQPLKGYFSGSGNSKFDADIVFGFDKNKNLIRIHWEFSFGATQTYTFGYD